MILPDANLLTVSPLTKYSALLHKQFTTNIVPSHINMINSIKYRWLLWPTQLNNHADTASRNDQKKNLKTTINTNTSNKDTTMVIHL